jgi:hypothetical protein
MWWPFEYRWTAAAAVGLLVGVIRLAWKIIPAHPRVITNSAYVLGRGDYAAAIPRMLKAMRRLSYAERQTVAEAASHFDRVILPHVKRDLYSHRWRIRCGAAQTLSVLAMSRSADIEAELVHASTLNDVRLVRPLNGLGYYRTNESDGRNQLHSIYFRFAVPALCLGKYSP